MAGARERGRVATFTFAVFGVRWSDAWSCVMFCWPRLLTNVIVYGPPAVAFAEKTGAVATPDAFVLTVAVVPPPATG